MSNTKVLIVEDNPITAIEIKSTLKKLGFYITNVVSNHINALQSIQTDIPHIIIMDIDLGAENGIDLAFKIRENRKIPILYLTACTNDNIMEQALESSPVGYLIKPFKREELKSTILLALYKINTLNYININQDQIHIGFHYYFDQRNKKLYYKSKHIKISLKERQLLYILSTEKDYLSDEKIEHYIWKNNVPSNSALRTLIYRLKLKLGCKIIEGSYQKGYKLASLIF